MEAVIGSLLLGRESVFCLGAATHGDVQLDECLIIAGWGVYDAVVVWGPRAGLKRRMNVNELKPERLTQYYLP